MNLNLFGCTGVTLCLVGWHIVTISTELVRVGAAKTPFWWLTGFRSVSDPFLDVSTLTLGLSLLTGPLMICCPFVCYKKVLKGKEEEEE